MLLAQLQSRLHPNLARATAVALALALAWSCARSAHASAPWAADPPGTDELWSSGFGVPQFDGAVTAAARYSGGMVVGGEFRVAGGVAARCIARWDGAHWLPLGDGLPGPPASIAVSGDTVWAAWNVRSSGASYWTGNTAYWDGQSWNALPELSETIVSVLIWQGRPTILVLAASGHEVRTLSAGVWAPVGAQGSLGSSYGHAFFADGDSLYFGGQFRNENTATSTPVLKVWDGTNWSVRASVTGGPNSGVALSIGSSQGRLMIGGLLAEVDGVPVTNITYREAGRWHAMGLELVPQVTQITDDGAGHPVAFGARTNGEVFTEWPSAARWDGSRWEFVSNDLYPWADGVVGEGGQMFAFGSFQQNGVRELHAFARLNGTDSSPLGSSGAPAGGLGAAEGTGSVNAIASYQGATVVGGAIGSPGDTLTYDGGRGVMAHDGNGWRSLTDGTYFGGRVMTLLPYADRLLAGGRFYMSLGFQPVGGLAQWDGSHWSPMGRVGSGTGEVDAFAIYHGTLYMGGQFGTADGLLCSAIAEWSGARWLPVGPVVLDTGVVVPEIHAMTVWRDRLIVGGSFTTRAGVPAQNIAAWDGTNWSPLPGLSLGPVTSLAATDSLLYVGVGPYFIAPQTELPGEQPIYAWDGGQWLTLPAPLNTGVRALLSTPTGLIVGSEFVAPDGGTVGLARFDGSQWFTMGSGLRAPVGGGVGLGWNCSAQALALMPDGLWVGGSFSLAGGKPSSRIARFEGLAQAVPPPGSRLVNAAPSPTTGAFTLRFRIANAGRVLVRMYDISGRQVATVHDAIHSPGPVVIPWSGQLTQGGSLRSGIYLMHIESAGEPERTSRIAIVR